MKRLLLVALLSLTVSGLAQAGHGSSYYRYSYPHSYSYRSTRPQSYSYNYSYLYVNSPVGSIGTFSSSGYGRRYCAPPAYHYGYHWHFGW